MKSPACPAQDDKNVKKHADYVDVEKDRGDDCRIKRETTHLVSNYQLRQYHQVNPVDYHSQSAENQQHRLVSHENHTDANYEAGHTAHHQNPNPRRKVTLAQPSVDT